MVKRRNEHQKQGRTSEHDDRQRSENEVAQQDEGVLIKVGRLEAVEGEVPEQG